MTETQPTAPDDKLLLQESDVPDSPVVLLVDLSSIAHPIWHVVQQEPDPDCTSQRTAAVVRSLAADHPNTAICCDSKTSLRKELDPTYKANRPAQEAPLYHQIYLAKGALEADGFPVWEVPGYEGDDLIATAVELLSYREVQQHVLIASADKDLLALVSDHVEVHSTRTGKRIGPAEVKEKLGVGPGLVVDYLTLVGDASDNIRGAKGIGPKTAVELLTYFGSVNALYSAIDAGSASNKLKPAQRASLDELRPRLEAVRELVRMRTDVPLDIAAVFQPRVPTVVENFMVEESMEEQEMENEVLPELETAKAYVYPTGARDSAKDIDLGPKPAALKARHARAIQASLDAEASEDAEWREQNAIRAGADPKPAVPAAPVEVVEQPAPDEWDRVLEPRSMHEACLLAKRMHESRMFSAYGTPQAVLTTLLLGRELGLSAMAALRSVHIIEGRHSLSAELMVALVLRSGLAEHFTLIESTDKICTYETKRKGATVQRLSYTIEQAGTAGLLAPPKPGKKPSPWHKIPTQMLRARCKSELARLEYPDILAGLYTPEELRDAKNGS